MWALKTAVDFLGTVAVLQKGSSCPSVRVEQLGSHWTDFRENSLFEIFMKIRREN